IAAIAWTIWRGRHEADAPPAFVLFTTIASSAVSAFYLFRCLTIATGIDNSSNFIEPTAWNLAISSIRILAFPLVYLSAILLVQGRTIVRLEQALTHDDLTGTLSRRAFLEIAGRSFEPGHSERMALLFLDLD